MGISGQVEAKCKICKCRFGHHIDSWLFIDEEVIGTCQKCFDKISHDCIDEFQLGENGGFAIVGRKEFKDNTIKH
jgi:hypothetical protein